jgi:hypothetical protein
MVTGSLCKYLSGNVSRSSTPPARFATDRYTVVSSVHRKAS